MIPKVIHYCWFGRGKKPELALKCIESWKKYCPNYEIIEWNEGNFDLDQHPYLRWCHDHKKWAFLSDLARLLIVEQNGGIYFDTDVEVIKNLDTLLENEEAFFAFETDQYVATGLGFGAIPEHQTVKAMIEQYKELIPDENNHINMIGCPKLNTNALLELGLKQNGKCQIVKGAKILPVDYMNPYDDPTGKLNCTENTVSIHWYMKSAMNKSSILRGKITRPFHRIFGTDCFRWLKF